MLSASKSYSERLFRYQRIDRLPREAADQALVGPAADEGCAFAPEALEAMYAVTAGYPYFIQAYGKVVWTSPQPLPSRPGHPRRSARSRVELAVGFFGSRFERATPAEREYLRAMADAALVRSNGTQPDDAGHDGLGASSAAYGIVNEMDAVATSAVADILGRKPQSLSSRKGCPHQEGPDLLR